MTISIDIPNAKASTLLEVYCKKFNLEVPGTNAEKTELLTKCVKHDLITLYRAYVQEQAVATARATLSADPDVAETELEAQLKTIVPPAS